MTTNPNECDRCGQTLPTVDVIEAVYTGTGERVLLHPDCFHTDLMGDPDRYWSMEWAR